jgi:hypothetical protein
MNHKLPILLAAAIGLVGFHYLRSNASQNTVNAKSGESALDGAASSGKDKSGPVDGQQLVVQSAQRLLLMPGIEAKTQQQVHVFGQKITGTGTYLQLTKGPRLMLRLDLKLMESPAMNWLQICDGDTYWVRRTQGEATTLARVNMRRLREVASRVGPEAAPPPPSLWMALGGLPRLLVALDSYFDFGPAKPLVVGELPVWSIDGRWKPHVLANLLPDQKDAILAGQQPDLSQLPSHLPHGVNVILGRDQVIPLFPYGISYYRFVPDGEAMRREPLATWGLYHVRLRPDLTASDFDYRPNDSQQVDERTDEYVARLEAAMTRPASASR